VKFKLDEYLPAEMAVMLRALELDASTVVEQGLAGKHDELIAGFVREEGRALVTLDLGFADVRRHPPEGHSGIIVLRLARQDKKHLLEVWRRVLQVLGRVPLDKQLWTVDEGGVRVRGGRAVDW
jgi:predicted nuclease of predicted toxin-antitoxin system